MPAPRSPPRRPGCGRHPTARAHRAAPPCADRTRVSHAIGRHDGRVGEVLLVRHGETEWSRDHRHTSVNDLALTHEGGLQAKALAPVLARHRFAGVFSSPRQRARRTEEHAGLTLTAIDDDLAEWNYGEYEGRTTAQIRQSRPDWSLWTDGAPGGESPAQIGARIDRLLDGVRPLVAA